MRILHLAPHAEWTRAGADGAYRGSTRDRTLDDVGFIHASTASQLPVVADGPFYADDPLDGHVLLVVDVAMCESAGSAVRWEVPGDSPQPFPHVYGPIPLDAVVAVLPVRRDAQRRFVLPDLAGLEVAEHPPAG